MGHHLADKPQKWQIVAPELRETHEMGHDDNKEWGISGFFDSVLNSFDVWGALARPVFPNFQIKQIVEGDDDYPRRMSLGMFDLLSNELLDMVIDNIIHEDSDIIALGLTCQGLWELTVPRLRNRYVEEAAPWAGKMIAFLGSYLTTVPPAFEENDFASNMVGDRNYEFPQNLGRNFFIHISHDPWPKTTRTLERILLQGVQEQLPNSKIPERRWGSIREDLKRKHMFPVDREWVLRNLTTKEYVSDGFTGAVTRFSKWRLENALLSQICWTNMSSVEASVYDSSPKIFEGKWAGDRFDIVTKDALMREAEDFEAWKDATDVVAQTIERHRHK
jgi:hypothetical protein